MRKKRVLYNSDYSRMFTGFGKIARNLLSLLEKTGKYEILEYAQGIQASHPDLSKLPWKAVGTLPDNPQEINELNKDPQRARMASYGEYSIEKVVSDFKPDVCIFNQDTWGNSYGVNKPFSSKLNVILWTTQDSVPLLESSYEDAKKTKHYWNWSSFATKEFLKKNNSLYSHVKTQYPPVDLDYFFPLNSTQRLALRKNHKIAEDEFVVGFVFRNQLRKLVPNLIEGFKMFKDRNPSAKTKLLLVTNFSEGWDIPRLAAQYKVALSDILTPYLSKSTNQYYVMPFAGQEIKNPVTGAEKDMSTVNILKGVSDEQLNELYNMMDVYCHPATSGACELPCVEAASAGKIVLTANYSFGEDIIEFNKGSFELDYAPYTEFGTQFVKSSVSPNSIAKQLLKVYLLNKSTRQSKENESRDWALKYYEKSVVAKQIEEYIDALPFIDWENTEIISQLKNPNYIPPEGLDDKDFVLNLYANILKTNEDDNGEGFKYWMNVIKNGGTRESILNYFQDVARKDNEKMNPIKFETLLDTARPNKRLLLVLKESLGDHIMFSSLLPKIAQKYEGYDIYLAADEKYHNIYAFNSYVHKMLPYLPFMENELVMVGIHNPVTFFDAYINVGASTQRVFNYHSQKF